MARINLICWLVAIGIIVCGSLYLSYLKNALEAEKVARKQCEIQLKEKKDAEISSSKLIKELRQKAEQDTPIVDCYHSRIPDYLSDELSKLK